MRGRLSALCALSLFLATSLTLAGCTIDDQASPPRGVRETPTALTSVDPVEEGQQPDGQVVRVDKYGISFELPQGWINLNVKSALRSSSPLRSKPAFKQVVRQLGTTPKRLIELMRKSYETYSFSLQPPVEGVSDSVNSVGIPLAHVTDARLKQTLARTGATLGTIEHSSSAAGDVTRVPLTLRAGGRTVHGVGIVVDVGDALVQITVSSHASAAAGELADQIQASLRPIDAAPETPSKQAPHATRSPSTDPGQSRLDAEDLFAGAKGYKVTTPHGGIEDRLTADMERGRGSAIVADFAIRNVDDGNVPVAVVLAVVFNNRATSADIAGFATDMAHTDGTSGRPVDLVGKSALYVDADPKAFVYAGDRFVLTVGGVDKQRLRALTIALIRAAE